MRRSRALKIVLWSTPLAVILLLFWIALTSTTSYLQIILGIICAFLVSLFSFHLLRGRLDPDLNRKVLVRFPLFAALLFWEIIKANVDVFIRVLHPRLPIDPRLVSFDSYLGTDVAKTILANSITLTPGTLTVEIDGETFYIHCLAKVHADGILSGKLERMVYWLFGKCRLREVWG